MKFNFKKSLTLCASALMMLSLAAPAANASQTSKASQPAKTSKTVTNNTKASNHQNNENKINNLKKVHANNVKKFNRIKQHIQTHQKNLQKLAKKMKKAKTNRGHRHHARNAALLKRLNSNKSKLINAIKYDQRGMLRLAKSVSSEEHRINLIRHPAKGANSGRNVSVNNMMDLNSGNNVGSNNHVNVSIVNGPHHHHYYKVIRRHHHPVYYTNNSGNNKHVYIHNHNGKVTGRVVINGKSYPLTSHEYNQAKTQMNGFKNLGHRISSFTKQLNRQLKFDLRM